MLRMRLIRRVWRAHSLARPETPLLDFCLRHWHPLEQGQIRLHFQQCLTPSLLLFQKLGILMLQPQPKSSTVLH